MEHSLAISMECHPAEPSADGEKVSESAERNSKSGGAGGLCGTTRKRSAIKEASPDVGGKVRVCRTFGSSPELDLLECRGCLNMVPRADLEEFEGRCASCGPAPTFMPASVESLAGIQAPTPTKETCLQRDSEPCVADLEKLARRGDSEAAFLLGQAHARGEMGTAWT